jgi:SAM-dependent methyltransferase
MIVRRALIFAGSLISLNSHRRRHAWYGLGLIVRGVEMHWLEVRDVGLSEDRAHAHGNSGGPDCELVLRALPISSRDSVLDLGCGMGGAMLTMAKFPFDRIDGLELSGRLVEIANRNLRRMGLTGSHLYLMDAADFTDYDRYSFLYLYHSFPLVVLESVLAHVRASLVRRARRVLLIYRNPAFEAAVLAGGFSRLREFPECIPPCTVYVSDQDPLGSAAP